MHFFPDSARMLRPILLKTQKKAGFQHFPTDRFDYIYFFPFFVSEARLTSHHPSKPHYGRLFIFAVLRFLLFFFCFPPLTFSPLDWKFLIFFFYNLPTISSPIFSRPSPRSFSVSETKPNKAPPYFILWTFLFSPTAQTRTPDTLPPPPQHFPDRFLRSFAARDLSPFLLHPLASLPFPPFLSTHRLSLNKSFTSLNLPSDPLMQVDAIILLLLPPFEAFPSVPATPIVRLRRFLVILLFHFFVC